MKLGAVIIPGVAFFIRSREFLRDLVLRKDSPGLCGSSKALMALGFSAGAAKRLEAEPNELGVMVYVACSEHSLADRAVEVLRRSGAQKTAALIGN
jgi:hypothetical protein